MDAINRRRWIQQGLTAGIGGISLAQVHGKAEAIATEFAGSSPHAFGIHVVDDQTGRGVPLVELRTVNDVRYYTDSAGYAAIDDPGLMNRHVYFSISSPGYQWPKDGFGYHGTALEVKSGAMAILKIQRSNIAERIYRITGEGIYSDTVRLGQRPPIQHPLMNGDVMGQDSALAAVYQGKIHWIWGDTMRPSYPLGNFRSSGAISSLPSQGGLNPEVGINLQYFTDHTGFCRPMCPLPKEPGGVVWLDGLTTVPDHSGEDRLIARYSRRQGLGQLYEQGLAVWDDKKEIFRKHCIYSIHEHWRFPTGHPARIQDHGTNYLLFAPQFPTVRCRATLDDIADSSRYEAFTCLAPDSQFAGAKSKLDRGADGTLIWAWKANTPPIGQAQEAELIDAGVIKSHEAHFQIREAGTKHPVLIQNGTFFWNPYLKKWIMIAVQREGTSFLGEIWLAAAAEPTGPWNVARKIATHPDYSFYNPAQNPFFDQENGRIIYFQGTYATTFSGNLHPVPRYDYNQLMYRLDLSDPRLAGI
jgi:hypothetical protein